MLLSMLLPMLLSACSLVQGLDLASFPEDRARARAAIGDVVADRPGALARRLSNQIRPQLVHAFPRMRAALPSGPIAGTAMIDARFVKVMPAQGSARRTAQLAYELSTGNRRSLAVIIIERDATARITAFTITPIDRPAAELYALDFGRASPVHYLMLLLLPAAVALSIAAIILLWRTALFGRRWLWTIGCLFGLGRLTLNWSTGELLFTPFYVQLLSAGFLKAGVLMPWMLSVGAPVVPIIVLIRWIRSRSRQ
ncbi:MAG: hypothetical protein ABW128_15305 [Rhizorhabdus sp.]